jgi:hypothetical protein
MRNGVGDWQFVPKPDIDSDTTIGIIIIQEIANHKRQIHKYTTLSQDLHQFLLHYLGHGARLTTWDRRMSWQEFRFIPSGCATGYSL